MTTKQIQNSLYAPDGSYYVTLTDGAGNLGAGSTNTLGKVQIDQTTPGTTNGFVQKDGSGNIVDLTLADLVRSESDYPTSALGVTPVVASSGDVANATASASIPAISGKLGYVTGFDITGTGSTALSTVLATLSGLVGGVTLTYIVNSVTGATLPNADKNIRFNKPIPANAVNTAITISCPALGVGNLHNVVNIYGYQL